MKEFKNVKRTDYVYLKNVSKKALHVQEKGTDKGDT